MSSPTKQVPSEVVDAGSPTFGGFLRQLRRKIGLTQRSLVILAKKDHVSGLVPGGLSHWEDGRRVPSPVQLMALARALRATRDDVLKLIELGAAIDRRYAGLVSSWGTRSMTPAERFHAWEAWAITFRPASPRAEVRRTDE